MLTTWTAVSQVNALIEQHYADYNTAESAIKYAEKYEAMEIEHGDQKMDNDSNNTEEKDSYQIC